MFQNTPKSFGAAPTQNKKKSSKLKAFLGFTGFSVSATNRDRTCDNPLYLSHPRAFMLQIVLQIPPGKTKERAEALP